MSTYIRKNALEFHIDLRNVRDERTFLMKMKESFSFPDYFGYTSPMFIGWAKQSKRLRKQIEEDINCEHCGAVNTTTLVRKEKETKKNYLLTTYFFKCKNCGHEHKETEKTTYNNGGGAIGGALFSGSRSSWGGGISGGSWGGGSSGGGGSSSRF